MLLSFQHLHAFTFTQKVFIQTADENPGCPAMVICALFTNLQRHILSMYVLWMQNKLMSWHKENCSRWKKIYWCLFYNLKIYEILTYTAAKIFTKIYTKGISLCLLLIVNLFWARKCQVFWSRWSDMIELRRNLCLDISGLMLKLVFDNLRIKSIPETYN